MLTDEQRANLRGLAQAATPGPWYGGKRCDGAITVKFDGAVVSIAEIYAQADATYIAAANPQTVTALLDEIDALRAEIQRLQSGMRELVERWDDIGSKAHSGNLEPEDGWIIAASDLRKLLDGP